MIVMAYVAAKDTADMGLFNEAFYKSLAKKFMSSGNMTSDFSSETSPTFSDCSEDKVKSFFAKYSPSPCPVSSTGSNADNGSSGGATSGSEATGFVATSYRATGTQDSSLGDSIKAWGEPNEHKTGGSYGYKTRNYSNMNLTTNKYFIPKLSQNVFNLSGGTFDLLKAINAIYNHSKSSFSLCTGFVTDALSIGFGNTTMLYGGAGPYEAYLNLLKAGWQPVVTVSNINSVDDLSGLPTTAYPGDIVFSWPGAHPDWGDGSYWANHKSSADGGFHTQMFTGRHWVSDFIQAKGILGYSGKVFKYRIKAVLRLPGIEKIWNPNDPGKIMSTKLKS